MQEPKSVDVASTQPEINETRLPWAPPALTDFGAVSEVTAGIDYMPGDGISNFSST